MCKLKHWGNSYAWNKKYTVNMWVLKPWQTNIELGDQLCVCGWPGTYRARASTCTVKSNLYAWNKNYNCNVCQGTCAFWICEGCMCISYNYFFLSTNGKNSRNYSWISSLLSARFINIIQPIPCSSSKMLSEIVCIKVLWVENLW